MGRPARQLVIQPPGPPEARMISDQLYRLYAHTEAVLLHEVATAAERGMTDWRKAFTKQQVAQVSEALERLDDQQRRWAQHNTRALYEHGLAVVDSYMMRPDHAVQYARHRQSGLDHWGAVAKVNEATGAPPQGAYEELRRQGMSHADALAALKNTHGPSTKWGPGGLSKAAHPGMVTPMDTRMVRMHEGAIQQLMQAYVDPLSTNLYRMDEHWQWKRFYRSRNLEVMMETLARGGTGRDFERKLLERYANEPMSRKDAEDFASAIKGKRGTRQIKAAMRESKLWVYTDAAGRQWDPKEYARMVSITLAGEASRESLYNRLDDDDHDLVEIPAHNGACYQCRPWEGEVLSVRGRTPGYPTVGDAESAGLFHPRCVHVPVPWDPDYGEEIPERAPEEREALLDAKLAQRDEMRVADRDGAKARVRDARAAKAQPARRRSPGVSGSRPTGEGARGGYEPPAEAFELRGDEAASVAEMEQVIHDMGLSWPGGRRPRVAVYDGVAYETAKQEVGLEKGYPGGWYDHRTHMVHMPRREDGGPHFGSADDWKQDLLHEMVHGTTRGRTMADWAGGKSHVLVEALTEVQVRAAMARANAVTQADAGIGPYGDLVYGLSAMFLASEIGAVITAADSGIVGFDNAVRNLANHPGVRIGKWRWSDEWDRKLRNAWRSSTMSTRRYSEWLLGVTSHG